MDQSPAHEPRTLADLLAVPGVLVARCGCGAVTPLDRVVAADLRQASLSRLEGDLRCTCGARRGAIAVWPRGLPTPASRDRLFLFVG